MVSHEKISQISDPRLDPYRELKKTNFTRSASYFIAEGKWVTERLLASQYTVESVLVAASQWPAFSHNVPEKVQSLVVEDDLVSQLVGFPFHAGMMACAKRMKIKSIDALDLSNRPTATIVAVPATQLPENLGSIIRLSAAFGCDAVVVGRQSVDVFSRRVIRVSMGNLFSLPIIEPADFSETIMQLREQQAFEIIAATLASTAEPLETTARQPRTCLMFGSEAHGLADEHLALTDRQVTLSMAKNVDSLNVAQAATAFLYQFTRILR